MIHVVARSEAYANAFKEKHKSLASVLQIHLNQSSYFQLINEVTYQEEQDWACIVHDDVLLPKDYLHNIENLIKKLEVQWPNWGLVGNAGISTNRYGLSCENKTRYLFDPHSGLSMNSEILPAYGIDGNVMLINTKQARKQGLLMPAFEGFHLYDIVLSIEMLSRSMAVLVAPDLACVHLSGGEQLGFDVAKNSESFKKYLAGVLNNKRIDSLNGFIEGVAQTQHQSESAVVKKIDLYHASLKQASFGRSKKTVAIVTRTQFKRPQLLTRTLSSVSAFIAAAGEATTFMHYLVSDRVVSDDFDSGCATVLYADLACNTTVDTRYRLVEYAAKNIDADFLWFLDDDDWLFPNEASTLALTINTSPLDSLFVVASKHFKETNIAGTVHYNTVPSTHFCPADFLRSIVGNNTIPFCGLIFSKQALLSIPPSAYTKITYFEDYFSFLYTLASGRYLPVIVEPLLVGISIRSIEEGQSVIAQDRSLWDQSLAEFASILANSSERFNILTLSSLLAEKIYFQGRVHELQQAAHHPTILATMLMTLKQSINTTIKALGRSIQFRWPALAG
ncbi:MAG: hypothetical protein K2P98_06435, partial [Neisseriaceae bacterium]|nr:hypothetical protein [Neisseriaceae bacterium]